MYVKKENICFHKPQKPLRVLTKTVATATNPFRNRYDWVKTIFELRAKFPYAPDE